MEKEGNESIFLGKLKKLNRRLTSDDFLRGLGLELCLFRNDLLIFTRIIKMTLILCKFKSKEFWRSVKISYIYIYNF